MLRDILEPSEEVEIVARMIDAVDPDVLVLQDFDYDAGNAALDAFANTLSGDGEPDYAYRFALLPNSGRPSEQDMDGDGLLRGPRDALGYGRFTGDGGMAILSRFPIRNEEVRDLSGLLWSDLPSNIAPDPPFPSPEAAAVRPLSSVGHWIVPMEVGETSLTLMTWSATPPVFDGDEDLNGRRANDETAIWATLLDGDLGAVPEAPFVILGLANIDPIDGDGRQDAIRALLADDRVQDPEPSSAGAAASPDPGQAGPPALDTAEFESVGNLRLSYILPSNDIEVLGSGVFWPAPGAEADALGDRSLWPRHRIVWADIALP